MNRMATGAALALCAGHACAQVAYDFTLVNTIMPHPGETYLYDVNDLGVAVGTTENYTPIGISYVGFSWSPAGGPTQQELSWPHGINNTGLAVATGVVRDLATGQVWNLPLLPGTYGVPYPSDINDAGIAVGAVATCNCSAQFPIPYVWDAVNGARTISMPGAGATDLTRINSHGVAIGHAGGMTGSDSFFIDLATGQYTLMSSVVPFTGDGATTAWDINDDGVVVGTRAGTGPVYFYGYVYSPVTGVRILPLPPEGYQRAFKPTTINNAGLIAGEINTPLATTHACLYDDQHGFRDLNDPSVVAGIPPGFILQHPTRINSNGWIVGQGTGGGWYVASFLLRPRTLNACYANCDNSTTSPLLTANDFQCFLNKFAAGDAGANCDQSTALPMLNANDFQCFMNQFATGCP